MAAGVLFTRYQAVSRQEYRNEPKEHMTDKTTYDNKANCINLLRFVFSMIVVLHHWIDITMVALPGWLMEAQSRMTSFAILGFFILSGYLIIRSYEHSPSIGVYFRKRARRILPPYMLIILACAFGLVMVSSLSPADYFTSRDWWMYLAANLSFLNFLHPTLPGVFESHLVNDASVNPALWTLKIEVGFYLILPLIGMLLRRNNRRQWIPLLAMYLLSVIYYDLLSWLLTRHDIPALGTLLHQLPGMLCYFIGGMVIYYYQDEFMRWKNYLIVPALLAYGIEEATSVMLLGPLAIGIIVMWMAFTLKDWDRIIRFGDVSYGMYVYHAPILKLMAIAGLFVTLPACCAVPLYVLVVFGVSFASWHLMEKQILHRK